MLSNSSSTIKNAILLTQKLLANSNPKIEKDKTNNSKKVTAEQTKLNIDPNSWLFCFKSSPLEKCVNAAGLLYFFSLLGGERSQGE